MFYYLGDYDNLKYGRKTEINRNYQKYPENRRKINQNSSSSKKRDNSAILRRAINKRYKEDIKEEIGNNNIKYNNYDEFDNNDYYEENYDNENYNDLNNYPSPFNDYDNLYNDGNINLSSFRERNSNPNYYSNDNFSNNKSNYTNYDQALLSRINNNRNRKINANKRNYYSSNISKDNINSEFIINYNSGINFENNNNNRYSLNRNKTQYLQNPLMNSQIYNNRLNNNYYQEKIPSNNISNNNIANSKIYYKYRPKDENYNDLKLVYQKRRINNYTYKDNKENGMSNTKYPNFTKKNTQLYLRNNIEKDNIFDRKINKNFYYTLDLNNNYERGYNLKNNNNINNNGKRPNNYILPENNNIIIPQHTNNYTSNNRQTLQKDINIYQIKCELFLQHFGQYFYLYYVKIVEKLFNYLKNKKNNSIINKLDISNEKIKSIPKQNKLYNKNKILKKSNYLSKYQTVPDKLMQSESSNKTIEKIERIPYHKNNNIIIERIKNNNQSVSPDKKNKAEMYRNIDELNKRHEIISNRKNRLSYNNTKRSLNDLSFNSENKSFIKNSVEKNKEIWENTINKERERKKRIKERKNKQKEKHNLEIKNKENKKKEKNDDITELIRKNEELKNKIENIIQEANSTLTKNKNNKNRKKNLEIAKNNNFNISSTDRKKIRDKYKKKNTNKKSEKYEMIDIKKIITKDKSIFINIKYLNYIPMKNKNKENNKNKFKLYQICNDFNICLLGMKVNNMNQKRLHNENNDNKIIHKLSSIQEENKIDLNDLSESISQKSDENKK